MGFILAMDVSFKNVGTALVHVRPGGPGDDRSGLGIFPAYRETLLGLVTVRPVEPPAKRHGHLLVADADYLMCQSLANQLLATILNSGSPDLVVMELPTGGSQGNRASRCMGMAAAIVAVLELWCKSLLPDMPFILRTPAEGKLAATGSASGSKSEVEKAVRSCYADRDSLFAAMTKGDREHACDALAALWSIRSTDAYRRVALIGADTE